ncbi:MAG: tripartite tricarboxylate transporter substrate binding protein [Castellaniella sp.]
MKKYLARLMAVLMITALSILPIQTMAQEIFPDRSVTIIASFPPGQATDVAARLLADEMAKEWQVPVVVRNQAGGLGIPAMQTLKGSLADGYTLALSTTGTAATNLYLMKNLSYSPMDDFVHIAPFFKAPLVITVDNSSQFNDLPQLLKHIHDHPGTIAWAIPGVGSAQHVTSELLFDLAGVDVQRVPYKGSADAVNDLIGGRVDVMTDSLAAALPLITGKRIRALAVTTEEQVPQLPDVAPVADAGFSGYSVYGWGGIMAPAGTPDTVVEKIAKTTHSILSKPDFQQRLADRALVADLRSQQEWEEFLRTEISKIASVLEKAGVPRQ